MTIIQRMTLLLALTLFTASLAAAQTTTLLPQGGLGLSCNAITAATSIAPGLAGGCASLALVTSGGTLPGNYTWQVITTGTPASLTVNFSGSLDGVTWTQLDTTSVTTGATRTVANANSYRFLGCIPATLTGGSSPTVTCQISVTSTATSGGSGTVTNTGGSLTSNAIVLGAGGNDTKVSTGITTNGASELDLGVSGTSGVLGLNGSTSGKATLTAPAVAGTVTNPIAISNHISVPNGSTGIASIQCTGGCSVNSGFYWASATAPAIQTANGIVVFDGGVNPAALRSTNAGPLGTAAAPWGNTFITTLSSATNCSATGTAANPSVAACGSAMAGSFSCATNASTGTCQVNTTAVTANSEIFIEGRNDTTTGTRLSVTCNTGITTAIPEIAAVTGGASFTINLGTFTTNPECFSYLIVN